MKKLHFLFLGAASLLALASCTSGGKGDAPISEPESSEEEIDTSNMVPVFVMAGQSNMQGNTRVTNGGTDYLKKYCDANEKDYNLFKNAGWDNVQHSYFGYYPYGGSISPCQSGTYTAIDGVKTPSGRFVNTKAGQALDNNCIGPELGMADVLSEATDKTVYLIKDAISGSGFKSQNNDKQNGMHLTWHTAKDGVEAEGTRTLYDELRDYTLDCLAKIEETGKQPVVRGFLWMQGETDADPLTAAEAYAEYEQAMVETFREDFAEYAFKGDGANIAFIDACIYDGTGTQWKYHEALNNSKRACQESSPDNNFLIDTTVATGLGLKLDRAENADMYHYSMDSMMQLGNEFAYTILDNNLLI